MACAMHGLIVVAAFSAVVATAAGTSDKGEVKPAAPQPVAARPGSKACTSAPGSFEVVIDGTNAVEAIEEIAARDGKSVRVLGGSRVNATIDVCASSAEDAIGDISRACGLSYRLVEGVYHIGPESELIAELASANDTTPVDTYYRCRHLDASTLVSTLKSLIPEVTVMLGPQFVAPSIQSIAAAGDRSSALVSTGSAFHTHDVILSGATNAVKRAVLLARKLDRQRKQVRISVQVTDVTSDALRELGIMWTWGKVALVEKRATVPSDRAGVVIDAKLGQFTRGPLTIEAQLAALETKTQARLLTNAHLVLLDGERSYVLTGMKYFYPKITSVNSYGTPNYTIDELKVGVYVQVAVQVGLDGDIVLTVYPEVSNLVSFSPIGDGKYPIVATREQQTTVIVRSGQTLAIGGLKQDNDRNTRQQIPFLGSIPLVGKFFQFNQKDTDATELVVLITPELVD